MAKKYIKITEYCENQKIESSFLLALHREGIVQLANQEESDYIDENDLPQLEMFTRWHYDLGINLEGIDAMRHMVARMKEMQREIIALERELNNFK